MIACFAFTGAAFVISMKPQDRMLAKHSSDIINVKFCLKVMFLSFFTMIVMMKVF